MAKITGLTFIMPVRDLERAVAFYRDAFEVEEIYRGERIVFVGQPGSDTAIGILLDPERAGQGPQHIGPHVDHSIAADDAVRDIERAGGTVVERGERGSGPWARVADPDGNQFEI